MARERGRPPRAIRVRPPAKEAPALASALALRRITAELLCARGVRTPEAARSFLDPRLSELRSPSSMAGFAPALDRLQAALAHGDRIGVFGDYDADGVTTAALLTLGLRALGADVEPRVARRNAGYGFGIEDADALADAGCRVVVTGDCGTSDGPALAAARARGLDAIVIDHHQVPDGELPALALLNPHQPSCAFPFKGMASVGIAFYLVAALRTRLREAGAAAAGALDPRDLLDLVALGTIADLAPLADENRALVTAGLRVLARRPAIRPGLNALCELADLPPERALSAVDVAFRLAPRLNAPGRLGEARTALDLLLAASAGEAMTHARACDEANQRRRVLQEEVLREAEGQIARRDAAAAAHVVAAQGWHPGVVGIVAAKLVEQTGRPVAVIALDGELGRGSLRSVEGFHLFEALRACAPHLVRFGGHAAAAGLTVEAGRLPDFTRAFEEEARHALGGEGGGNGGAGAGSVLCDAAVEVGDVDLALCEEIARLEPFGVGNPEPLLALEQATVRQGRIVGERHLALTLAAGDASLDAIAFGAADRWNEGDIATGASIRVAFVPEIDEYRGRRRARARVVELSRLDPPAHE